MNELATVVNVVANFYVQKCIAELLDIDLWLSEPVLKTIQIPEIIRLISCHQSIRTTNTYRTMPIKHNLLYYPIVLPEKQIQDY